MSETLTSNVTTIVEPGNVIYFRQPVSGVKIHGVVTGIVRHEKNGSPWLTVNRRADGRQVVVGLHEVVKVGGIAREMPIVKEDTPVIDAPVMVIVPERVRPAVTAEAEEADIADRVRYVSPNGRIKVGVVVEIDTLSALIEVGKPATLELIDRGDIMAVLAA